MIRTRSSGLRAFEREVGPSGPIAIEGARTRWDRGGTVDADARLLRAPDGVLDSSPGDMTVRVLCGTEVAELHQALGREGQRTALPERGGTVGGALAVGDDDLSAPGLGTVRAALLECTTVSAEGRLVTGGGPTVKNVSGYDVPRLMVGALGTLGPLVEVLLRTVPDAPASRWWRADDADVSALRSGLYRPAALCSDGTSTWVHLRGHVDDVAAQHRIILRHGSFVDVEMGPRIPAWRWVVPRAEVGRWVAEGRGNGLACLLTGRLWRSDRQPERSVDPNVIVLHRRMRQLFDPTGRFNPGRDVLRD